MGVSVVEYVFVVVVDVDYIVYFFLVGNMFVVVVVVVFLIKLVM